MYNSEYSQGETEHYQLFRTLPPLRYYLLPPPKGIYLNMNSVAMNLYMSFVHVCTHLRVCWVCT